MLKSQLIKKSPIRVLDKTIHGGLGAGNLGAFTARKGVGKTASLVHVATDKMLRGEKVCTFPMQMIQIILKVGINRFLMKLHRFSSWKTLMKFMSNYFNKDLFFISNKKK